MSTKRKGQYTEVRNMQVPTEPSFMKQCKTMFGGRHDLERVKEFIATNYHDAPKPKERTIHHELHQFLRKNNESLSSLRMYLSLLASEAVRVQEAGGLPSSPLFMSLADELQGGNKLQIGNLIVKEREIKSRKQNQRKEALHATVVEILIYEYEFAMLLEKNQTDDNPLVEILQLDPHSGGKDSGFFSNSQRRNDHAGAIFEGDKPISAAVEKLRSRLGQKLFGDGKKEKEAPPQKSEPVLCDAFHCHLEAKFYCKDCDSIFCRDHNRVEHTGSKQDHQSQDLRTLPEASPIAKSMKKRMREPKINVGRIEEMRVNAQNVVDRLRKENPDFIGHRLSKVVGRDFDEAEFNNFEDVERIVRSQFPEEELNDEVVTEALRLSRGSPEDAVALINERRKIAIDFLQPKSETLSKARAQYIGEKCRLDRKAMLILLSEGILNSVPKQEIESLEDTLKNIFLPEEDRSQIAAQELFSHFADRQLRGQLLVEMLSFEHENRQPPGDGWWRSFHKFTLDDLVSCVEDLNNPDDKDVLVNCPMLNNQCEVCYDYYHKNKIFEMECRCTYCLDCVIRNLDTVIGGRGVIDALQCLNPQCPSKHAFEEMVDEEKKNVFTVKYQRLVAIKVCYPQLKQKVDRFERIFQDYITETMDHFTRCAHCEFGQVQGDLEIKKMTCFQCKKNTCHDCKQAWFEEHADMTCGKYRTWLGKTHPELLGLQQGAAEPGSFIECPNCKHVYVLQRGGCLHFTCKNCKHEFCGFCYQTFYTKKNPCTSCDVQKESGLHAHHPRHCFTYLRDESCEWLIELLEIHKIDWEKELPDTKMVNGKCGVKITDDDLVESDCGHPVQKDFSFCERHLKEFLSFIIFENNADPIQKMDQRELGILVRRENIELPSENLNIEELRAEIARQRPLGEDDVDD